MKKEYVTPTAEKIRFNYRDQVVAASGEGVAGQNGDYTSNFGSCFDMGDVVTYLLNAWGYCKYFV